MKKIIFMMSIILLGSLQSNAQIKRIECEINTIEITELQFQIYLDMDSDETISPAFNTIPGFQERFEVRLESNDSAVVTGEIDGMGGSCGNGYVVLNVNDSMLSNKGTAKLLFKDKLPYYIFIPAELQIQLVDSAGMQPTRLVTISPALMKKASGAMNKVEPEMYDLLVRSLGGENGAYNNKIDIGRQIKSSEASINAYYATFSYYGAVHCFRYWFWSLDGRLSTNKDDALNRIAVCPMSFNKTYATGNIPTEYMLSFNIEANQSFTVQRYAPTAAIQAILPNMVDFTNNQYRLRLKPVLKVGMKGLFEYENKILKAKQNDGQVFGELYYYIPIMKTAAIYINAKAFNNFTAGAGWEYNYDVSLGTELPSSNFKLIAKYSRGISDINCQLNEQSESQVMLGLLLNLLDQK